MDLNISFLESSERRMAQRAQVQEGLTSGIHGFVIVCFSSLRAVSQRRCVNAQRLAPTVQKHLIFDEVLT